jgi:Ca-activated chloride channel family protein
MPLLSLNCALSNRFALVEGSSKLRLLVEAKSHDENRLGGMPLNLILVVDRSSSMTGEAMDRVKSAAKHIVDTLTDADGLGVVAFSDEVQVVYAAQLLRDKAGARTAIDRLRAAGATNIHEALTVGHREAMRNYSADRVNRIIFLSDGEATAGVTDDEPILKLADTIRGDGLALSTLGVGEEYDEVLLSKLARQGGGNHYFIQTPDAISTIFAEEVAKAKATVAKNLKVHVRPTDDTQIRMINQRYRCETVGNEFTVYLDELANGRPQATILEVELSARPKGEFVAANLELVYDNLVDRINNESVSATVGVTYIEEGARIREGINREVLRRWEELTAMQDLKSLVDELKDHKIDSKTAILELDKRTQVLVKKKAIDAARAYAAVGKTILDEGGVSTNLAKRTMVACEEAEQGGVTGKTLLEE